MTTTAGDVITTTVSALMTSYYRQDGDDFFLNESWTVGGDLNSTSVHGYSDWHAAVLGCLCGLLVVGTIVGNILVCIAVGIVRRLRTPSNLLIVSLAVSDLLVAILDMPFAAAYEVMGRWALGSTMCDIWTSLDVLLCTASILNLCAISIDRYFVITRPFQYAMKRTPLRMFLMITVVWIMSAIISIPPLFVGSWKKERVSSDHCFVSQHIGYQIYATIGAFYLPLTVMIVIYVRIYMVSYRIARAEARSKPSFDATAASSLPPPSSSAAAASGIQHQQVHLQHPHLDELMNNNHHHSSSSSALRCGGGPDCGDHTPTVQLKNTPDSTSVPHRHCTSAVIRPTFINIYNQLPSQDEDDEDDETPEGPEINGHGDDQLHGTGTTCLLGAGTTTTTVPVEVVIDSVPSNNDLYHQTQYTCTVEEGQYLRQSAAAPPGDYHLHPATTTTTSSNNHGGHHPYSHTNGSGVSCPPGSASASSRQRTFSFCDLLPTVARRSTLPVSKSPSSLATSSSLTSSPVQQTQKQRKSSVASWCSTTTRSRTGSDARLLLADLAVRLRFRSAASRETTSLSLTSRRSSGNSSTERKATKTLGVIMGAFTFCWLPFFILALYRPFCPKDDPECIPRWLNGLFLWLGYANSLLNPIIYARFNRDFRTPFKHILQCHVRDINVRLRTENYTEQFGAVGSNGSGTAWGSVRTYRSNSAV